MIAGAVLIVLGIVAVSGGFANTYGPNNYTSYDHGFATFGADYYTYSVNNSASAANAAASASNNARETVKLLESCLGIFMIFSGVFAICGFGAVFAGCANADKDDPVYPELTGEAVAGEKEVFETDETEEETSAAESYDSLTEPQQQ